MRRADALRALNYAVQEGHVARTDSGVRGNPYLYGVPTLGAGQLRSTVPIPGQEIGNGNSDGDGQIGSVSFPATDLTLEVASVTASQSAPTSSQFGSAAPTPEREPGNGIAASEFRSAPPAHEWELGNGNTDDGFDATARYVSWPDGSAHDFGRTKDAPVF
jgi:hypothetical protein